MATVIARLQANNSNFRFLRGNVRCVGDDSLVAKRVFLGSYAGDCNPTVLWRLHIVCSTSSRSREPPTRRNSRSQNPKQGGSSSSKDMGPSPDDMSLLRDLQEFISSADLPPHQVPSTRELARHGRQDLANAVRRRGNKAVSQLLANPNFLNTSTNAKPSKTVPVDAVSGTSNPSAPNRVVKPEVVPSTTVQPQNFTSRPETTDLVPQNGTGRLVPYFNANESKLPLFQQKESSTSVAEPKIFSSSRPSINEGIRSQGVPRALDVTKLSEVVAAFEEGDSDDEDNTDLYTYEDSSDEEDNKWAGLKSTGGFPDSHESEAWQKATMLRTKLQSFFDNPISKDIARPRRDLGEIYDSMATQQETERLLEQEMREKEFLSGFRTDPAKELERLSALLHTKEIENLRLSRELEETKALLALVRARHGAEVAQAKQVAVEKELRLQSAEQALHALKLVQVDWWGEGSRVELAGSFNGWEHHVYLLPDLSSEIPKLNGLRGPMLWRAELWLYPGVYEIKFIVDGKWQVDHRREIVQQHMGQNNILYVDP